MKDPAFLFYSKDFYEGTRLMLPEERACYIDLLIYQHQNGIIPLDLKRIVMYCSGIDLATLEATLEAKFERTDKGWSNVRLQNEILGREKYKTNQSDNGKVGQFFKKAKQILKAKEFLILSQNFKDKEFILTFLNENEINKDTLEGLLKRCLNNKGNVNGNEDVNKEVIPTLSEFGKYAIEKEPTLDKNSIKLKYDSWVENGWKDGNNKKIINWKSKLLNTIPYLTKSETKVGGSKNVKAL